ncbi:Pycsar system effector family protein [Pseudomonas azerbaijanoccidentalis]
MSGDEKMVPDLSKIIEQKIKNQFEVLKRMDVYIGTTNTKCTIIMSYCAAVIALIFALLGKLDLAASSTSFIVVVGLSSGFSLITAIICMLMACFAIFPVTDSSPDKYRGSSLIFYADISNIKGGSKGYVDKVNETTDAMFLDDLSGQVFSVGTIVSSKFKRIQQLSIILCAHFFFAVAFLSACVCYFLY